MPTGCGLAYCPRCSRRRGRHFVRNLEERFCSDGHGDLYHLVLTQQRRADEELGATAARFAAHWERVYRRLKVAGVVGALRTTHIVWKPGDSWHYHVHVLIDMGSVGHAGLLALQAVCDFWVGLITEECGFSALPFLRLVASAHGPYGPRELTQGEFWRDDGDKKWNILRYVAMDVCQGVDRWVETGITMKAVLQLIPVLRSHKLRRLYGVWRRRFIPEKAPQDTSSTPGSLPKIWLDCGTVDGVITCALSGLPTARAWLHALLKGFGNGALVAKRLRNCLPFFCF